MVIIILGHVYREVVLIKGNSIDIVYHDDDDE